MHIQNTPTYLRVVATAFCNMKCSYCHMEGDPHVPGTAYELPGDVLTSVLRVARRAGIRKLKFLGGEPLLRKDLPAIIRALRAEDATLDISAITAGVMPARTLETLWEAGLSRLNMSIHGFDFPAFAQRRGNLKMWHDRNTFLRALLKAERPVKINFVLSGAGAREDLAHLLEAAKDWPVVVSVLDDLNDPAAGPAHVIATVEALRGPARERMTVPDPHSLPTLQLVWDDGLRVEVKDHRLGDVAPYGACSTCPKKPACREGIFALRLTHGGLLQPCMDRPDLSLDIARIVRDEGQEAGLRAWEAFCDDLAAPGSARAA
jgi:cyclic pyranopterin phosphate synthase